MMQNKQKIVIIGVTGGVGTGKSKVLSFLAENYQCRVLQADVLANELKQPGQECYESTISLLGSSILNEDRSIDNKKMASIIFSTPELLQKINAIIHPMVKKRITQIIEEEKEKGELDFLFIEAALLIEGGYQDIVDELWYVYASDDVRRKRLKENRGYTDQKIEEIMTSQLSKEAFEKVCDFVLNNTGLWEETTKQVVLKMEGYSWEKK